MKAGAKITEASLAAVRKQLKKITNGARPKVLRAAMRKVFKPVQEDAKSRVPVDTHELRESIQIAWAKGKTDTHGAVGIVTVTVSKRAKQARVAAAAFGEAQSKSLPPSRRWHFVELGTSKMRATPFLRPALEANADKVVKDLGVEVTKGVKRVIKKGSK